MGGPGLGPEILVDLGLSGAHLEHCLLEGLDEVGLTLARDAAITAYEEEARARLPFLAQGVEAA